MKPDHTYRDNATGEAVALYITPQAGVQHIAERGQMSVVLLGDGTLIETWSGGYGHITWPEAKPHAD